MGKIYAALLFVGLILFSSTPALANYFSIVNDFNVALIIGGGLFFWGIIGNQRLLKK